MRILVPGLVAAVLLFGVSAQAQEYPRAEIFGGASLYDGAQIVYGWQASGAVNFARNVGFVADVGGQYDEMDNKQHQFLFGPRVRTSQSRVVGFGHALFGGQHIATGSGFSDIFFAMGIGGGMDVFVTEGFGIRAIQFDWVPIKLPGNWFYQNYRYGIGVVIPLGN